MVPLVQKLGHSQRLIARLADESGVGSRVSVWLGTKLVDMEARENGVAVTNKNKNLGRTMLFNRPSHLTACKAFLT